MNVKLMLITVTLMLPVPTPLVVSHVPVTRATVEMDSPVQVRVILVTIFSSKHFQQTLMNVKLMLITVTLMLPVPTPLVVEMDSPVQVRVMVQVKIKFPFRICSTTVT